MSSGVIYSITCPEGKSYIGKTTSRLSVRISRHKSKSSNCRAIRDAIVKNGIDNMTVKVLMKCSHHDLDENETLYITAMDTLHPRGYNLRCGSKAAAHKPDFKVSQHIIDVDEDVKNAVLDDIADLSGIKRTSLSWGGPITVTLGELNYMHGAKMNSPWAGPRPGQVKKEQKKLIAELTEEREKYLAAKLYLPNGLPNLAEFENTSNEELAAMLARMEAKVSKSKEEVKKKKREEILHQKEMKRKSEDYIIESNAKREKIAKDADLNNKRREIEDAAHKRRHEIEDVAHKIRILTSLGMDEEAAKLKDRFVSM
jgi:hypothetical protein